MIEQWQLRETAGWHHRPLNNGLMAEYWCYLSGKQSEMVNAGEKQPFECARLVVRFGEYKDIDEPIVYLALSGCSMPLYHIRDFDRLMELRAMLYQDEIDALKWIREHDQAKEHTRR